MAPSPLHPTASGRSAPARRLGCAPNGALAALWAGFLVAILIGGAGPVGMASLNDWTVVVFGVGAAVSSVLRVVLVREQRAVWAPLALGLYCARSRPPSP